MTTGPVSENLPGLRYNQIYSGVGNLINLINHSLPINGFKLREGNFEIVSIKPIRYNDDSYTKLTIRSNIKGKESKVVSVYYKRVNLGVFDNSVATGTLKKPLKLSFFKGRNRDVSGKLTSREVSFLCERLNIRDLSMTASIVEIHPGSIYKIKMKPSDISISQMDGTYCHQGECHFYLKDIYADRDNTEERIVRDEDFGEIVTMTVDMGNDYPEEE